MLEKSCRWWPIWYLLFFCHGAEGQLQWVVKEKVTAYGQNLILFCPVENCCSEPAGWFVGPKSIILDVKTFSNDPKLKYHGTYNKDGFGVVIRNLSEADLNVTYRCIYGFDQSTPKYLLHGDVFRENVPDKDKEIDTAAKYTIVVLIVVIIMVGAIIGIFYCVYRSRIEKKRQKQTVIKKKRHKQSVIKKKRPKQSVIKKKRPKQSVIKKKRPKQSVIKKKRHKQSVIKKKRHKQSGTNDEIEDMYHSDIEMKNHKGIEKKRQRQTVIKKKRPKQSGTNKEMEDMYHSNIEMKNHKGIEKKRQRQTVIKKKRHKQSGTNKEMEDMYHSDIEMKNHKGIEKKRQRQTDRTRFWKCHRSNPHGTEGKMVFFDIQMEHLQDEAEALTKEENNFLRLYFLCQKIATQAVRFFFDNEVPGHTLESFLKQHRSNLTHHRSVYRCTKDQEAKLFPGGHVVVVSTDFDFTLLYKLIRNLLTAIPAPTRGWGIQPLPGHLNETDDIERIRHLRNNLAHNSDFKICDTDFSTHWTDLSEVIDRLSKGTLSTDVESMRTKSFDKCIRNEMEDVIRKELKEMHEDFMELQQ